MGILDIFRNFVKRVIALRVVNVLNRALVEDQQAVRSLFAHRVLCNEALANDTTIQIAKAFPGFEGGIGYSVSLLGVINGIIGVDKASWGYLAAVYDLVCSAGCVYPEEKEGAKLKIGDPCPFCEGGALRLGPLLRFEVLKR